MSTVLPLPALDKARSALPPSFMFRSLGDAWRYRWAIETFVKNNLRRRYRRSALGFLWGLLGPLLTMTTMATVFSILFHADIRTYTVYVFSGSLPWSYISESAIEGSHCFIGAESFLKKLFIPKLFFPLVSAGTDTVNFLFSLASLLTIGLFAGVPWQATMVLLPVVIAINATMNLGMTILFGVATVYFRDLSHILRVTLPALFYTIPILYRPDLIPEQYRHWFLLNPFYYLIDLYRQVILEGQIPPAQDWAVSIALAACFLFAGLLVLKKKEHDLIFRM